jgi:general secretion pathway protein K
MKRMARGAAIILAMLLAALAATIAATLLWQQQRWISDHEHRRDQVQAQALAMAGVQWARQIIYDNAPGGAPVHAGQPWALRLPAIPLENGSISGYVVDAQSRFNVNNLAVAANRPATRAALSRLVAALGLPDATLDAFTDWVDDDDRVTAPGGAEDAWYLAQASPGLAANAPVTRASELMAVRGVSIALLTALRPFVGALDAPTAVNVNTAPPEVLAAVASGLDRAGAQALVTKRTQQPFTSVADFRARLPRPDITFDDAMATVTSSWFEVSIEARQGDTLARARALLKRAPGQVWPVVVWQTVE